MNRRAFLAMTMVGVAGWPPCKGSAATAAPAETRFRIAWGDYRKVEVDYLPQLVDYATDELTGTIVVDTANYFLYLILGSGRAKRYGVAVGREGFGWLGTATIGRKAEWPRWVPPKEMMERDPKAARWPDGMPGGGDNPLGARALYLYQGEVDTLLRIHGTPEPGSIGRAVSSGCIRMLNADIVELYDRVEIGTKVHVMASEQPVEVAENTELPVAVAEQPERPVVVKRERPTAVKNSKQPVAIAKRTEGPVVATKRGKRPVSVAEAVVRPEVRSLRAPRVSLPKPARRRTVAEWLRSLEDQG